MFKEATAADSGNAHANPPAKLRVVLETGASAQFVHVHLGVPSILSLSVFNDGTEAAGPGEVLLCFSPAFAKPLRLNFDGIAAQSSTAWKCPALEVQADILANASEAQEAIVHAVVRKAPSASDAEGAPPLYELSQSIRLLAFNEWPGLGEIPELLAAFVTPNQTSISELLHGASEWMRHAHGQATIDGYQSGEPRRALRIVEAIFNSVLHRQIAYVNPPPSYEPTGQKVRLVEQVWLGRQGACLDLTLLFASALEAAGLHPLVCVEKGHAFVGCWLREDRLFDLSFEDDVQALRKGVDGLNLCVFETTLATQSSATFAIALNAGRERLENESEFRWALDISRARSKRVRPLPLANQDGRIFIAPEPKPLAGVASARASNLEDAFAVLDRDLPVAPPTEEAPNARVARWKRQLLDLSLRNRLLNLSEKGTVRLLPGSIIDLEDHMAKAGEVRLLERPIVDGRDAGLHRLKSREDLDLAQLKADLADQKLRTDQTKDELEASRTANLGEHLPTFSAQFLRHMAFKSRIVTVFLEHLGGRARERGDAFLCILEIILQISHPTRSRALQIDVMRPDQGGRPSARASSGNQKEGTGGASAECFAADYCSEGKGASSWPCVKSGIRSNRGCGSSNTSALRGHGPSARAF